MPPNRIAEHFKDGDETDVLAGFLSVGDDTPPYGRDDWEVVHRPSNVSKITPEIIETIRKNPPPISKTFKGRSAQAELVWMPLFRRFGFDPVFTTTWTVWYNLQDCSWEHLCDFIQWHLDTGAVPVPVGVDLDP